MNGVLFQVLAFGLVIALSPMTIVATILMLLPPHGRRVGLAFLVGWVAGLAIAVVVFHRIANLAGFADEGTGDETWVETAWLALGCLLLLIGGVFWRRHRPGTSPPQPAWMRLIDRLTPLKAFVLGAGWAGFTPKNLLLLSAAVVNVVGAELATWEELAVGVVLVAAASLGVAIPVFWTLYRGERAEGRLATWRVWLTVHNAAIMAIVCAAAGVLLIGKSIGGLDR
jgi:hypothetical protein